MLSPSVPVLSSNSHRLVLVSLVLGLVLGAAAVGLTWFVSGRPASATELPHSDAGTDAVTACAALARIPALTSSAFVDQKQQGLSPAYYRLAGAEALAQAAAAQDSQYKTLADSLNKVLEIAAQTFDLTSPQAAQALNTARTACADL